MKDLGRFKFQYGDVESGARWLWVPDPVTEYHYLDVCTWEELVGDRDAEDMPKYNVELRIVRLDAVSADVLGGAVESAGIRSDIEAEAGAGSSAQVFARVAPLLAAACVDYGAAIHAYDESSNNWRAAAREAARVSKDEAGSSRLLSTPFNRIGQTWGEMLRGDLSSAMRRASRLSGDAGVGARVLAQTVVAAGGQTLGAGVDRELLRASEELLKASDS